MKTAKLIVTLTLLSAIALSQNALWAAASHEQSVTVSVVNPTDRVITQMPSFSQIVIDSDDKDAGYVESDGGSITLSSNDTYRIQGKITGNTLDAKLQVDNGNLTALSSSYTDLYTNGQAALDASHDVTLRFDVDWSSAAIAGENVTLSLKVLTVS